MVNHFILTRFNLPLWKEDKNGRMIDREEWLKQRFELFETYCLPSIINQSCKDFVWVLLCDENTPIEYRERIKAYKDICPQIELIQVEEEYAWEFPHIFADVVKCIRQENNVNGDELCITTYLDNDDALHKDYVLRIQQLLSGEGGDSNRTQIGVLLKSKVPFFLSFDYGLQYFTSLGMATRVKYPNNHFVTCVEYGTRTCYGYGSHFLLEKNGIKVIHVIDNRQPMWIEVVHEDNVDNDVKMTFDTHLFYDEASLKKNFGLHIGLRNEKLKYVCRVVSQMFRRTKGKFVSRKWR